MWIDNISLYGENKSTKDISNFKIDTGSYTTTITQDIKKKLKLKNGKPVKLEGIGDSSSEEFQLIVEIENNNFIVVAPIHKRPLIGMDILLQTKLYLDGPSKNLK